MEKALSLKFVSRIPALPGVSLMHKTGSKVSHNSNGVCSDSPQEEMNYLVCLLGE